MSSTKSPMIPPAAVDLKFVKSSGPGGQHVNKTSSACEGRMDVRSAAWLPSAVKSRLLRQQKAYCNAKDELIVSSQEERSQHRNRARVLAKMQEMVDQAWPEPKIREMITGVSEVTKSNWIAEKKFRSKLKDSRRVHHDDY